MNQIKYVEKNFDNIFRIIRWRKNELLNQFNAFSASAAFAENWFVKIAFVAFATNSATINQNIATFETLSIVNFSEQIIENFLIFTRRSISIKRKKQYRRFLVFAIHVIFHLNVTKHFRKKCRMVPKCEKICVFIWWKSKFTTIAICVGWLDSTDEKCESTVNDIDTTNAIFWSIIKSVFVFIFAILSIIVRDLLWFARNVDRNFVNNINSEFPKNDAIEKNLSKKWKIQRHRWQFAIQINYVL